MKKAIAGFILFLGLIGLYKISQVSRDVEAQQAQQAQVAAASRPHDIQVLLKRSAVRDACTKHPEWSLEDCQTIDQQKVQIGMTAEQVRLSWGKPKKINTTTYSGGEREQWVYGDEYLYVSNGVLKSMQTTR